MRGRLGRPMAAAGVAGGLLLAGLVGCGSDLDGTVQVESSAEGLAQAAAATEEVGTGRFESVAEVEAGGTLSVTTTGEFDTEAGQAQGEVVVAGDGVVGELFASLAEGDFVVDGDTLYLDGLGEHDGWVRVDDATSAAADGGVDPSTAFTTAPGGLLDQLDEVTDVTEVGRGEVRGVSATHLRATLPEVGDLDEAAAGGGGYRAASEVDVWVDDEGLVRRIATTTEADFGSAGPAVEGLVTAAVTTTTDLYDLGAEVEVAVPAEATDLDDLAPEELFGDDALGQLLGGLDEGLDELGEQLGSVIDGLCDGLDEPERTDCEQAFEQLEGQLGGD